MERTLKFLTALKENNNQGWLMDHIGAYEQAKTEVSELAYLILDQLSLLDLALDCEIDVNRFISTLIIIKPKKKLPYHTLFNISISPLLNGGNEPVYRLHINPEGSYMSVLFEPDVFGLQVIRSFIVKNIDLLEKALTEVYSAGFVLNDAQAGALPKGYQTGVIGENYIKLPFYELRCPLDLCKERSLLIADILTSFSLAIPFVEFFRKGLGLR
ncbi:DUF2461 family protein [Pedobacter sp. G11]|uniref:DUF2461 family protein n=1 Tax=Pedobacter sp. G11 TaxID=2482728 RepID=UPI000F5FD55B|nr:DUF2461 family protein [Pedobacter sp. G11]AZI25987.1 DUF2461 family protein [Pedobacter sp. G11]